MIRTSDPISCSSLGKFCPQVLDFPKADAVSRRTEFREHQNYDKKDFSAIEYMLRKGQRQLEIYSSPGIRNVMK